MKKCKYLKENVDAEPWARGAVFPRDSLLHLHSLRAERYLFYLWPTQIPLPSLGRAAHRVPHGVAADPKGEAAVPYPFGIYFSMFWGKLSCCLVAAQSPEPCPRPWPSALSPNPSKTQVQPLLLCRACLSEQALTACEMGFAPNTELAWLCCLSCCSLERPPQSTLSREYNFSPSWIHPASLTSEQGSPGDHWGLVWKERKKGVCPMQAGLDTFPLFQLSQCFHAEETLPGAMCHFPRFDHHLSKE